MSTFRPDKCVPFLDTLLALLYLEGGTCEQEAFHARVRAYFGSDRWKGQEMEWDNYVLQTLRGCPHVTLLGGDAQGDPVLPSARPRDRTGLGDLFWGLQNCRWRDAVATIVFRMRRRGDLAWMIPALEGQISPEDLARAMLPTKSVSTQYRWARMIRAWCEDLGPVRPVERTYKLSGRPVRWSFLQKLGPNVTSLWLAHHNITQRLLEDPHLARVFSISRNAGVLGEQTMDAVFRKIRNNSGAKYIVNGTLSWAMFRGWVERTIVNAIRDAGRNPTTRSLLGALTDKERQSGLDRTEYQVPLEPEMLLARIGDPSSLGHPESVEDVDLEERVMERLRKILADEGAEGAGRMMEIFRAFYDGDDIREIALSQRLSEKEVTSLLENLRGHIIPVQDDFLDLAGHDEISAKPPEEAAPASPRPRQDVDLRASRLEVLSLPVTSRPVIDDSWDDRDYSQVFLH